MSVVMLNENKDGYSMENCGNKNASNIPCGSSTNCNKVNQETSVHMTNFQIFMGELLDSLRNVNKIIYTRLQCLF